MLSIQINNGYRGVLYCDTCHEPSPTIGWYDPNDPMSVICSTCYGTVEKAPTDWAPAAFKAILDARSQVKATGKAPPGVVIDKTPAAPVEPDEDEDEDEDEEPHGLFEQCMEHAVPCQDYYSHGYEHTKRTSGQWCCYYCCDICRIECRDPVTDMVMPVMPAGPSKQARSLTLTSGEAEMLAHMRDQGWVTHYPPELVEKSFTDDDVQAIIDRLGPLYYVEMMTGNRPKELSGSDIGYLLWALIIKEKSMGQPRTYVGPSTEAHFISTGRAGKLLWYET